MWSSNRRRSNDGSVSPLLPAVRKGADAAARTFEKYRQHLQTQHLQTLCPDQDSQHRLAWLQRQFSKTQRGARESARAEIDIATLLVHAGSSVSFVKETGTRTAESRSNIRLTNVHVGEWVSDSRGFSQIRSLIVNPAAAYAVEPAARIALQRVL